MSEGTSIDYPALMTSALKGVVARVLQRVSEEGLPGNHFFYLTLRTDADGVEIPPTLLERYPEEITIVLQNQFWDLYADDRRFAVNLRFDGVAHRLVVPFDALTAFDDPVAEFALRFIDPESEPAPDPGAATDARSVDPESEGPRDADSPGATVVRLDSFRKS